MLEVIQGRPELGGLPANHRDAVRNRFKGEISDRRKEIFGTLPISPKGEQQLEDMAVEMLVREHFGPLKGGLVVAGFGDKEYMPSLVAYELEEQVLS